jgi:PKD repeat protein
MNKFLFIVLCLLSTYHLSAQKNSATDGKLNHSPTIQTLPSLTSEQYKLIQSLQINIDDENKSVQEQNHRISTQNLSSTIKDGRNLPLNEKGELLSVDGNAVIFKTPNNENISSVCYAPNPIIASNANQRDASCGYVVACDNASNRDAADFTTVKYFQLVWHVMRNGGASTNISQARIDELMAELNADFAAFNMIFCADPATFYENATHYNHDMNTEEFLLKNTFNTNPTQVINVYVVGTMTAGGYARYPYDPAGGTSATGGIVLNRGNCFTGTHTLAHEMGHVFGLYHTFAGVDERTECSSCYERVRNANGSSNTSGAATPLGGPYTNEGDREGDWCSDTNPHDTHANNCSTSSNSNGACDSHNWANAPINNHMSYSFCSSQFTTQQSRRMHCMVDSYLGSWTAYGGAICGSNPPVADFSGTPTNWQVPALVNFTDQSTPSSLITNWTWIFDTGASNTVSCVGCTGTNATYVGQNPPAVTYSTAGTYSVRLTVSNVNGSDAETKNAYITVNNPSGDCDTLDNQWFTPAPGIASYTFAANDYLSGIPCPTLSSFPNPIGVYESYFSPNPGVTPIGAVRVGLGNLLDANDNTTFQLVVYDDDGFGAPGALVGGLANISPTDLGVPGAGFYDEIWIPFFEAPIPTTAQFHIGVEIFPGDAADRLTVLSSTNGQGQGAGLNHVIGSNFGTLNYLSDIGLNFDLNIFPLLGEYAPTPIIYAYAENVVCDTTYVTLFDTAFYSTPTSWSFTFSDGTVINSTTDPGTIDRVYTTAGPETVTVTTINDCGRESTTVWTIPYNFIETPNAEFSAAPNNPICTGGAGVNFTAAITGYNDYTWDFGDGNVLSTGNTRTANHVYAAPGSYYVELSVTNTGYAPADTFYLQDFESGWPAGYVRFNMDAFIPNVAVNPPFTGSNATAWLPLDVDGNGDTEAVSTSWNGAPGQLANDWMITTAIGPLPANQRLFWDAEALDASYPDGYQVRISTTQTPANTTNFSTLLFSTPAENAFNTTRSVDLSAYAGQTVYIAFRNNSNYMNLLFIDDIRIGTTTDGCTAQILKTDFIEVVNCSVTPPTAVITTGAIPSCLPASVTFSDGTTAGDPATSWLWNFGDGTFSTAQDPPPHIYSGLGAYFVSFEACNAGGCTTAYTTINITGSYSYGAFTDTICANSIYTLPSGTNVFGPGAYLDTIPGSTCDSIITATLITAPSSLFYGLYGAYGTNYNQVNPLTGATMDNFTTVNNLGWVNNAFTIHQQDATLYWLNESKRLESLHLPTGTQTNVFTDISTLPYFWSLRFHDGYIYTITASGDNDKVLRRILPTSGAFDAGFPGIEVNGSAAYEILFHASPVINPLTGIFYLPISGNNLLAFDIDGGTGNIVTLSGAVTPGSFIGLLEINETTGEMYAISGFNNLIRITITGPTTATATLVKAITSASGFSNPVSAFDSDNDLYIFQAAEGCTQNPLVAVDVNTGQEWCTNPAGAAFYQLEYLNCKPSSVSRVMSSFNVNIYPNPARDNVTLEVSLAKNEEVQVQVFNMAGRQQMEKRFAGLEGDNLLELNLSNLNNGVYIIHIYSGGNQFAGKVVKL